MIIPTGNNIEKIMSIPQSLLSIRNGGVLYTILRTKKPHNITISEHKAQNNKKADIIIVIPSRNKQQQGEQIMHNR